MNDFAPQVLRTPAMSPPSTVARLDDPALEADQTLSTPIRSSGARYADAKGHHAVNLGPGTALGPGLSRQGLDLSQVRVHDDGAAARLTEAHGANAVTVGSHIAFAPGKFRPGTPDGDALIEHELRHVAQQAEAGTAVIQRDGPEGRGLGRTAPAADYEVNQDGEAATEDFSFTFGHDSAATDEAWAERIRTELEGTTGPVTVDVHGYASDQGDTDYNVNLSAHRAVAVARLLESLLPEGSQVNVVAHGTTTAFGDNVADNRRVGVDVHEVTPSGPLQLTLRPPAWSWNFRLRPPTLGPINLDPEADTEEPNVDITPRVQAPITTGIPPWLLTNPVRPAEPPGFRLSEMHLTARRRGATLSPGDAAMARWHYNTYYGLAAALYGLGGRLVFDDPSDIANLLTSTAVDFALQGDNPTAVELFQAEDNRLRQLLGLPTSTPLILRKTWEF